MTRPSPLRSLAAIALIGALGLLLGTSLCAPEICPMGKARTSGACRSLGSDCCQTAGERTAHAPVQVPPPALMGFKSAAAAISPVPEHGSPEPSAAPAILQGVGLHTLLSVFLI
jgi:hypothetical protein